jgi:death on curing protein
MDVIFLTVGEVLRIHETQMELFGGQGGVRDLGLLESAIAVPQAGFSNSYLHADIFEMAAAYLFHIVQNHPFLDGNKRTGTVAAIAFLGMNDIEVDIDDDALVGLVFSVAEGKTEKASIADFLRSHAVNP